MIERKHEKQKMEIYSYGTLTIDTTIDTTGGGGVDDDNNFC